MQAKLQELTDKLYQEGVSKAQQEADRIVSEAKAEAEKIKRAAQEEAAALKRSAEEENDRLKETVETGLKNSAQQAESGLKQRISELITAELVDKQVDAAFDDGSFMKKLIETVVSNWKTDGGVPALDLVLPAAQQAELESFVKGKAGSVLKDGVSVAFSDDVEGGFKIGPQNSGFQVSFTEEGFRNYFKEYLRPRARKYLYGEE